MKINIDKTKAMIVGEGTNSINIGINREQIEYVDSFKYIGVKFESNGKVEGENNDRKSNPTKISCIKQELY